MWTRTLCSTFTTTGLATLGWQQRHWRRLKSLRWTGGVACEPLSTTVIVLYVQSNTHREPPEVYVCRNAASGSERCDSPSPRPPYPSLLAAPTCSTFARSPLLTIASPYRQSPQKSQTGAFTATACRNVTHRHSLCLPVSCLLAAEARQL